MIIIARAIDILIPLDKPCQIKRKEKEGDRTLNIENIEMQRRGTACDYGSLITAWRSQPRFDRNQLFARKLFNHSQILTKCINNIIEWLTKQIISIKNLFE